MKQERGGDKLSHLHVTRGTCMMTTLIPISVLATMSSDIIRGVTLALLRVFLHMAFILLAAAPMAQLEYGRQSGVEATWHIPGKSVLDLKQHLRRITGILGGRQVGRATY